MWQGVCRIGRCVCKKGSGGKVEAVSMWQSMCARWGAGGGGRVVLTAKPTAPF